MASVLELAVNTGKWDAGLKKAKAALDNFTQASGGLKNALDKDSEKMSKFVGMMGKAESTAKTAKGQMNDYKSTIEQLTMQYNRMSEAQKKTIGQDYLRAIDQLKSKYKSVSDEVKKMNDSLNGGGATTPTGGGFLSGKMGGAMAVLKGNLMTMGAMKIGELANEMQEAVKQGIELAKAGEGIRIAFERLNRPDLLNNLREATHGTVTDIELMKAAVQFNDFRLPLDEMGTLLAFAQQKAKDTGQSVDYMVQSITTGLGRQSLMILDNLGLSASEIRERMKETGDMTKAVAEIIREQMAKAGDHVDTAADRAKRADVEMKNALEQLGRTFLPLQEAGKEMFDGLALAAINALNKMRPFFDMFTQAGRMRQAYEERGGGGSVAANLDALRNAGSRSEQMGIYGRQIATYNREIAGYQGAYDAWSRWRGGERNDQLQATIQVVREQYGTDTTKIKAELDALKKMHDEYIAGAKQIFNPEKIKQVVTEATGSNGKGGGKSTTAKVAEILPTGSVAALTKEMTELRKEQSLVTSTSEWSAYDEKIKEIANHIRDIKGGFNVPGYSFTDTASQSVSDRQQQLQTMRLPAIDFSKYNKPKNDKKEDETKVIADNVGKITGGVSNIFSGLEAMGIEIPEEMGKMLNAVNGVMSILTGISSVITSIAVLSALPFARGGVIRAATGYTVPGNHMSGDMVPALLNSGETVFNRAQMGVLASALEDQGEEPVNLTPYVEGDKVFLGVNNSLRQRGQGEIVTTKMLQRMGLI